MYSGLSGCTASQYLMKPSVIPLPSRKVSLESVIWTMRPITPSSRLRVIAKSTGGCNRTVSCRSDARHRKLAAWSPPFVRVCSSLPVERSSLLEGQAVTEKRGTLWAAILGSCIVFLDSTVVEVALPRIGRDLPAHLVGVLEGQSYVYSGYLLAESAFLILAGGLTDVYGRRKMFTYGLVGFGAASLLSGLTPTMEWLIVFRVIQGMAGALLVPGALALITATFSGEEQGRAFGVWSGASAGLAILGPFIGGLLVDSVSWRSVFLLNVPLVLTALWVTTRYVRESRDPDAVRGVDAVGTLLTALAVGGLAIGTISGQQREWQSPGAFAALGIGTAAAALLPFWMLHARNPLIPPALFRSRNFTVTNLST